MNTELDNMSLTDLIKEKKMSENEILTDTENEHPELFKRYCKVRNKIIEHIIETFKKGGS